MARLAGVDLPREKRVEIGLTYIYGIGLCKGKKNYDKRDVAAKKEATRTIDRELKERMR